jgi:PadR family transcriptional regulator, regulatory protein PadR
MPDALPLTETTFFILFSLAEEPRHGYSIIQEVERLSDGRIRMAAGTLYGAIKRLVNLGWIRPAEVRRKKVDDRERKYYQLTKTGAQVLAWEVQRLRKLASLVREYQPKADI